MGLTGDNGRMTTDGSLAPLVVVSGPSGVGKGTVVARALELSDLPWLSVSATTRKPRPGETHGVDYFFVDDAEFDRLIAADDLLEWAEFSGNRYGTPRSAVMERRLAGRPVILEIEVLGARQVRERMPDAHLLFVQPPSWEELRARLVGRGTETPEQVEARLENALRELETVGEFDSTIVNDQVDDTAHALLALLGIG